MLLATEKSLVDGLMKERGLNCKTNSYKCKKGAL
jgi:hypothetical protein